jgi:hypothetical protein
MGPFSGAERRYVVQREIEETMAPCSTSSMQHCSR